MKYKVGDKVVLICICADCKDYMRMGEEIVIHSVDGNESFPYSLKIGVKVIVNSYGDRHLQFVESGINYKKSDLDIVI